MRIRKVLHYLFKTDIKKRSLLDITSEELREYGVKAIALDADNTSAFDRTTDPLPGAAEWIEKMKSAGFPVVLVSNAKPDRARVLAEQFDIPVVGFSMKPLPFGYLRTCLRLRMAPSDICMIGDQLFTDILGANAIGVKSIYVYPYEKETRNGISFAVKRFFERAIFWYQNKFPYIDR